MISPQPTITEEEVELKVRLKKNDKRDEFAKEIVKAIISSDLDLGPKEIAEKTYFIADEMLTSRDNYL